MIGAAFRKIPAVLSCIAVGVMGLGATPASADPVGSVTMHQLALVGAEMWGVAAGPDDAMWFTDVAGGRIVRRGSDGAVSHFDLPDATSYPTSIVAGPDGNLWFTEYVGGKIGRITPSGVITDFDANASGPWDIAAGPDGNLWYTDFADSAAVVKMTPTGSTTRYPLEAEAYPKGITAGPDGNLWFTESGSRNRIGRITPSGTIDEFNIGLSTNTQSWDIAAGPDGNLWFTEYNASKIGRITPSGTINEFSTGPQPWGIATGPDGALWFTQYASNAIGRMTTAGSMTEYTGAGAPWLLATGPDGSMWFANRNGDSVGQMTTGTPPPLRAAPSVTGTLQVGQTQQCSGEQWDAWNGAPPTVSSIGWLLDGRTVPGATGRSFTPALTDVGRTLACTVTATYSLPAVTVKSTSASVTLTAQPAPEPAPTPTPASAQLLTCKASKHRARCTSKVVPATYRFTASKKVKVRKGRVTAGDVSEKVTVALSTKNTRILAKTPLSRGKYTLKVGRTSRPIRVT